MKKVIFFYILYLAVCISVLCIPTDVKTSKSYVEINHIIKIVQNNWESIKDNTFTEIKDIENDFFIIDNNNEIILKSSKDFKPDNNMSVHLKNKDVIVDVNKNNVTVGKIVFINNDKQIYTNKYRQLKLFCFIFMVMSAVVISVFLFIISKRFLKPIYKIKKNVDHIISGNLEMPLIVETEGIIGDFADSFNTLRESLFISKNNEILLKKKNKELIASLSHDIKTPVASIKAVAELLSVQEENDDKRSKLFAVITKAEQINLLAENLLHTTLEELDEWEVFVCEESSEIISGIIKSADYKNYILPFSIVPCLIKLDKNKALQIFDNIINNSYKYANTPIIVKSECIDKYLKVSISDSGNTISDEDIDLITQKFYRGKNSKGHIGTGLGMYISKSLIEKMGGKLFASKEEGRFCINIYIPLA
ncbi:hypothetical protein HMPREF9333_00970 [Johnsonella ignava ATCC 51276]|uniref:histidine kinase n=1 Tax=Johnsonella ignava ATCC 51276 TaxID=679200 RepID=G5GHD0_9FIRM|nr:HAMP domain-containing sensor histidine kinase [Johnsonella ignava]EHI55927.1 hypothetical protein HMPREF9333_00970 [Johnsonella ignava ATCC 51276]